MNQLSTNTLANPRIRLLHDSEVYHPGVDAVGEALQTIERSLNNTSLFSTFKNCVGLSVFGLAPYNPKSFLLNSTEVEAGAWVQEWQEYETDLRKAGLEEIPGSDLRAFLKALVAAGTLFPSEAPAHRNALQRAAVLVADFIAFKANWQEYPDCVILPFSQYLYDDAAKHNQPDERNSHPAGSNRSP